MAQAAAVSPLTAVISLNMVASDEKRGHIERQIDNAILYFQGQAI